MPKTEPQKTAVDAERHLVDSVPLTVGGDCVATLLKGAVLRGLDPNDILTKAGLNPELYANPNLSINGVEFRQLVFVTRGQTDDLFMGFMAQPADPVAFERALAPLRFQCTTLGEALRTYAEMRMAVRNDISYDFIDDGKARKFTLRVNYDTIDGVDREFYHWFRLTATYRYCSWLIGRRIVLDRACFEGPEPADPNQRRRYSIFDCEIRFNQPTYAITFDRRYLQYPIVRKSETEHEEYNIEYPDWFDIPGHGTSWARRTEQALIRINRKGNWSPTIEEVGNVLAINGRGLRRRLAQEGISFAEIRNSVRCQTAIAYLITTDLPITVIAEDLGYADAANFNRAFNAWTGVNPSAYRAEHAHDEDLVTASLTRLRANDKNLI